MIELQINLAWAKFRAVVTDKFGTQVDRVQREASFIAALAFGEQTASFVLTRV